VSGCGTAGFSLIYFSQLLAIVDQEACEVFAVSWSSAGAIGKPLPQLELLPEVAQLRGARRLGPASPRELSAWGGRPMPF